MFQRKQRRSRSQSRSRRRAEEPESNSPKGMLMSTEEALALVHGDMATIRDGDVTHQCIQTNLADVICGGKFHIGIFGKAPYISVLRKYSRQLQALLIKSELHAVLPNLN